MARRKQSFLPISFWFGAAISIGSAILAQIKWEISGWGAYFAVVSVVTLIYYGYDKFAAKREWGRIPEVTLHALALIGGAIGALLGQRLFRHKTVKIEFQRVFWVICGIQAAIVIAVLYFQLR